VVAGFVAHAILIRKAAFTYQLTRRHNSRQFLAGRIAQLSSLRIVPNYFVRVVGICDRLSVLKSHVGIVLKFITVE